MYLSMSNVACHAEEIKKNPSPEKHREALEITEVEKGERLQRESV